MFCLRPRRKREVEKALKPVALKRGDAQTYLHFRFIACHLKRIPAADHMNSTNVVARINLPNMAYDPKDRVEVYAQAQEGLIGILL